MLLLDLDTLGHRKRIPPGGRQRGHRDGPGGGVAGDTFSFTVPLDPEVASLTAPFGPEFTFTGEMVEGEITIDVP